MDFVQHLEGERLQRQVEIGDVLQQLEQERSQRKVEIGLVRFEIQETQGKLGKISDEMYHGLESMARCLDTVQQSIDDEVLGRQADIETKTSELNEAITLAAAKFHEDLISLSLEIAAVKGLRAPELREDIQELKDAVAQEKIHRLKLQETQTLEEKNLTDMVKCRQSSIWEEMEALGQKGRLADVSHAELKEDLLKLQQQDSCHWEEQRLTAFFDCRQSDVRRELEILGEHAVLSESVQAELQENLQSLMLQRAPPPGEEIINSLIDKQSAMWTKIESLCQSVLQSEAIQTELQCEIRQSVAQQAQFAKMIDTERVLGSQVPAAFTPQSTPQAAYRALQAAELQTCYGAIDRNGWSRERKSCGPSLQPIIENGHDLFDGDIEQESCSPSPQPRIIESHQDFFDENIGLSASNARAFKEADPTTLIRRLNALRDSMRLAEAREGGDLDETTASTAHQLMPS